MLAKLLFIFRNWNTIDVAIFEADQKIAEAERERTRNHLYLCAKHTQRVTENRVTEYECAYCQQIKALKELRGVIASQRLARKAQPTPKNERVRN